MTLEQALIKIIELQDQIIKLKSQPVINPLIPNPNITVIDCLAGGICDFPQPWFGTQPPTCRKCDKSTMSPYTVTYGSTNTAIVADKNYSLSSTDVRFNTNSTPTNSDDFIMTNLKKDPSYVGTFAMRDKKLHGERLS